MFFQLVSINSGKTCFVKSLPVVSCLYFTASHVDGTVSQEIEECSEATDVYQLLHLSKAKVKIWAL